MAKRPRRRGLFDPDYRKQGWNTSRFAPKNGSFNITQISILITLIPVIVLFAIPETRRLLLTIQGFVGLIVGVWIVWFTIAILIRRWEWRRIQRRMQSEEITFEEPDERPAKSSPTKSAKPETQPRREAPVDPIQSQLDARRARLQNEIESHAMTPSDFEYEVAWVLNTLTPYKAVRVGGAGDRGVDVKVYDGSKLIGIVQCKRFLTKNPVDPVHVRALDSVKNQFGVKTAYLITTARFSRGTRQEAKKLGIKLMDGEQWEDMRKRARMAQRQTQKSELKENF